jgi:hypothetical protein
MPLKGIQDSTVAAAIRSRILLENLSVVGIDISFLQFRPNGREGVGNYFNCLNSVRRPRGSVRKYTDAGAPSMVPKSLVADSDRTDEDVATINELTSKKKSGLHDSVRRGGRSQLIILRHGNPVESRPSNDRPTRMPTETKPKHHYTGITGNPFPIRFSAFPMVSGGLHGRGSVRIADNPGGTASLDEAAFIRTCGTQAQNPSLHRI